MSRGNPEYHLTCAAAQCLALHLDRRGVPWVHFPAGEKRGPRVGAKLKKMGMKPGWPDIQIIPPNAPAIFIELKAGSGSLSKSQKRVHRELTAMGCLVSVCSSIDAILTILESEGLMDLPLLAPVEWTGRAAA